MIPGAKNQKELERITKALSGLGFVLPGSLIERNARCGRESCGCHDDPPRLHGPYHQWTRKIPPDNKTVTRLLSDELLADYGPWFENERKARRLLTELEMLSLSIVDDDPRWKR
jgi:hypothetical protein